MDKVCVYFGFDGKPQHIVQSSSGRTGSYLPLCGGKRLVGWKPKERHSVAPAGLKLTCWACQAHLDLWLKEEGGTGNC